jgi:hypothetical protein
MMGLVKNLLRNLSVLVALPAFVIAALLPGRREILVWGSSPLISNKYWSEAMRQAGYRSMTIMDSLYGINRRADFDRLFVDFAPKWLPHLPRFALGSIAALVFALRNARVMHMSYDGFALGRTWLWWLEPYLFRLAGVKTVVMPYGADGFVYSDVIDISVRHALLAHYPQMARKERRIRAGLTHWNKHADVVIAGLMVDGNGRWDVPMNQIFVIDTDRWLPPLERNDHDGRTGPVRVIHTPNHRLIKGTEFVIAAVDALRSEGLDVELILLEGLSNDEVLQRMRSSDILAEQFLIGYGLSGIEGMACGLAVMSNLEREDYTRVFRRYSFLNECPVLSAEPENLEERLRLLVTHPRLRNELAAANREFALKYHSYRTAQYLFGAIYRKLFEDPSVDLMNLFNPRTSPYNLDRPIRHPLVNNAPPAALQQAG